MYPRLLSKIGLFFQFKSIIINNKGAIDKYGYIFMYSAIGWSIPSNHYIGSICLLSTSIQKITLSAFHCNFSKYIEMFSFSSGVKTSIAKIFHYNLNKIKTIAIHSNPINTQFRAADSHIPTKKSFELRFFLEWKKTANFCSWYKHIIWRNTRLKMF